MKKKLTISYLLFVTKFVQTLRHRLFKWIFLRDQGIYSISLNGDELTLRKNTTDYEVATTTINEFNLLSSALPIDYNGIIIDGGGYIGTAAIAFSKMYPKAKIVSVEANLNNYKLLCMNCQAYPNIIPLNRALYVKDGEQIEIKDRGTGHWGSTIIDTKESGSLQPTLGYVETISLKTIIDKYGKCDLIKLDIEGAEKSLFEEDETLEMIKFVFVELHERIISGCNEAFEKFTSDRIIIKDNGEKFLSIRD